MYNKPVITVTGILGAIGQSDLEQPCHDERTTGADAEGKAGRKRTGNIVEILVRRCYGYTTLLLWLYN